MSVSFALAQKSLDAFLGGNEQSYERILVQNVVNPNTLVLDNREHVKLIGLNIPKEFEKNYIKKQRDSRGFVIEEEVSPTLPLKDLAFEFVKELLEGQYVRLEFDVERKNIDEETLAYVFLAKKNIFVNAEILRQGYALLQVSPPNTKYVEQLRSAYQEASREKRGLQGQ